MHPRVCPHTRPERIHEAILYGVVPTRWLLTGSRAAQGLGSAAMMAHTLALVGGAVPKAKTGRAMGLLATRSAIGTTLGPSVGGVLIARPGWRTIFLVKAPPGIPGLLLAHRCLPVDHRPVGTEHPAVVVYCEVIFCRHNLIPGMELRHLRYFVAVAEALSFTKAAARLHVAQPALSRQVSDLEEELGVDLLKRTSHGVLLTEEGKCFLAESREILKRAQESMAKVRAVARGEVGELQVGYLPPLDLHILPRALAEFQKTTPGVRVVLHDLGTDELCHALRNGTLHLVLMMRPTDEAAAGIEFEEVGRYPYFVAMAPSHPLAKMKTVSVDALAGQPLIVMNRRRNSEHHRTLFRVFAPQRPNIATETDSVNSLVTEVSVGKCVALVSQLFKEAVGKRLAYRKLVNTEVAMRVGIARASNGDLPPAAEKLCVSIRKIAGA